MNGRLGWSIVVVLAVIIVALAVFLFAGPTSAPSSDNTFVSPFPSQPFESENVNVTSPLPNAMVAKKFTVVGEARGLWYFEASFPVQVRDPQNNLVGQGIAQAGDEWMTTEFVPFTAPVTVTGYSGPADLVLLKDNPSGLPEHDDAVLFPIVVQ
ncbi:hypothetical protein A3A39_01240 [Candidatus Kaiserbacteria bacterium RIFCSPLOWO2_01_FULL_54_13]|uniref:Bacterial spore germination immunoglobulin-like domain-containing protein n=1 Tax=Candidatus Kaiserbacteria bacterium RIFCSPLOWO2_01_FULL_54_13 TaxID=1798512 RepID=A0A1F6F293_9BACT|nr:MAG: hypothetical protein A3A39_01240 [Candidatus Kaiserbacteria bacterium RIFCSPLOWO2_01_FULL_54_13]